MLGTYLIKQHTFEENMMNLPQEVQSILGVFRVFGDKIYLAGGAVRNHLFDLPIKDYDLCLLSKNLESDLQEIRILSNRLGMDISEYTQYSYSTLKWEVVKLTKGTLSIDILLCCNHACIHDVIEDFQCNASMVFLDEHGEAYGNNKFADFYGTKELKFYSNCAESYKQRMRAYFK